MMPTRAMPQTNLRIPQQVKDGLKRIAARNGRSMNSEIIQVLVEHLNKNGEALTTRNSQGF
ncbi:hypothetical protein BIY29_05360 [Brenneria alni]|uniref:Arc-like DNA binding domain-containing protein n=1 Tax=Brenneria alni TaxID=71656 RepID=A0A421DR27_9GAMM|nr:Arc family DNA-binding protein [Brenneria alni]RLM26489.1 hypothetical protein BIY29_05360 [Brenneria alni]